jgi:hypothetical protein
VTEEPNKRLLLDHILLSPAMIRADGALTKVAGSGRIEHDAWTAQVAGTAPAEISEQPTTVPPPCSSPTSRVRAPEWRAWEGLTR